MSGSFPDAAAGQSGAFAYCLCAAAPTSCVCFPPNPDGPGNRAAKTVTSLIEFSAERTTLALFIQIRQDILFC
jgi:hypothetical protein